jgi:GNAT superfamily N-acetyltransferase
MSARRWFRLRVDNAIAAGKAARRGFRRKGVGAALTLHALAFAREAG